MRGCKLNGSVAISYCIAIFVVRKNYKTEKAQDLLNLVLFCYHILWFASFAEYLNSGVAF